MMIEGDKEGWNIHSWKDDARKILSNALKSKDKEARGFAIDLVNRLGARGFYEEFRDLLKNMNS